MSDIHSSFNKEYSSGIVASEGIAMGKAIVLANDVPYVPKYVIQSNEVESELRRLRNVIDKEKASLDALYNRSDNKSNELDLNYLKAHKMLMDDPEIHSEIEKKISKQLLNVEAIFKTVMDEVISEFDNLDDGYLKERVYDLKDIRKKVLMSLLGKQPHDLSHFDNDVIIVAYNLSPSQTAEIDKEHVKGLITEIGGKTSHSAILARALDIPVIVGFSKINEKINRDDFVILDAIHKKIIVRPTQDVIERYVSAKQVYDRYINKAKWITPLRAKTTDGVEVNLYANIEIKEELFNLEKYGLDGIGLYRSEYLFLDRANFPSENEQFLSYKNAVVKMVDKPVIIRTIDLGGDKISISHKTIHEQNPFLGWRSIRFCLDNREVFKTQLRALFRASVYGKLRIMIPMISGLDELEQAMAIIDETKADLRNEKINFNEEVKIGIMMEVPSAVMVADNLAQKVDFFSIGTNDLIQYTIAVDRNNERVAPLYKAIHPAVLKMIKIIIDAANKYDIPVEMCGEMAGDRMFTVLLLGLGLKNLSMTPSNSYIIKRNINNISIDEATKFANKVLKMSKTSEIENYIKEYMHSFAKKFMPNSSPEEWEF